MTVTYLDAFGDKHLAPEALFISALIQSGNYAPESYQVRDEYFQAYLPVHEFCAQYQRDAGHAPNIGLVRAYSKSFPYLEQISPVWAAERLKEHWQSRVLRKGMIEATLALKSEDFDIKEAHGILKQAIDRANPSTSRFTAANDYTVFNDSVKTAPIPMDLEPTGKLTALTDGGIRPGNLWYVAARLGTGKTYKLIAMAVAAAEAGTDSWFYSTEMTDEEVMDRIHRIALRKTWPRPWKAITKKEQCVLFDEWQERAALIKIIDPSSGAIDSMMIAGNHQEGEMAFVDYIGRMKTSGGSRSIEDWRMAGQISNELKEIALTHRIPIVCAAQINREGAKGDGDAAHRAENLSQSDAIGQDADVLLTSHRVSARLRFNSLTKSRHGADGTRWHSLFDPDLGQFMDVDAARAAAIKEKDAEVESAFL